MLFSEMLTGLKTISYTIKINMVIRFKLLVLTKL
nr:MAG TPA: hypothetical protein [Crassvirales sp.]